MPCFMTGTAEGDANLAAQEANKEVTKLTRLLCAVCAQQEQHGNVLTLPASVQHWWTKHKEIDAKRKADELQRAARTVKF